MVENDEHEPSRVSQCPDAEKGAAIPPLMFKAPPIAPWGPGNCLRVQRESQKPDRIGGGGGKTPQKGGERSDLVRMRLIC